MSNYTFKLEVKEDFEELYDCIISEGKTNNYKRSQLTIKKNKEKLDFIVEADDTTALRATINGVMQSLIIFDKMRNLGKTNE